MEFTQNALELIGLDYHMRILICRVLSAILHMGEVRFELRGEEESGICNPEALHPCGELLGCDVGVLGSAFTSRTMMTVGESVTIHLHPDEAEGNKTALAKVEMCHTSTLFHHSYTRLTHH